MTRIAVMLACMVVGMSCARPQGRTSSEGVVGEPLVGAPSTPGHRQPPPPTMLLIVDSTLAFLDTTMQSRARRDSLLGTLAGRVIRRVRTYAPGDTTPVQWLGSRAQHGVVWIETRPF